MLVSRLLVMGKHALQLWPMRSLLLLLFPVVHLFNQPLFLVLNSAGRVLPDSVWAFLSFFGDGLTAFVLILPFARHFPRLLGKTIIAVVVSLCLSHGLKYLTHVPRPLGVLPDELVHVIGIELRNHHAFPSGHAVTAFLFAGLLLPYLQRSRARIPVIAIASLAALSRVMVGAHWPLDVLAGSAVGLFSAWLTQRIAGKWRLGETHWVHMSFIWCFLVAAYYMAGYTGGFAENAWMGWVIGVGVMVGGLYQFVEIYLFPEQLRRRLYATAAERDS